MRKGFDTSPLLNRQFDVAEREYIKGIAPDKVNEDPENIPELLIHSLKRIHKAPTQRMMLAAQKKTGLTQQQILDVWNEMWESA